MYIHLTCVITIYTITKHVLNYSFYIVLNLSIILYKLSKCKIENLDFLLCISFIHFILGPPWWSCYCIWLVIACLQPLRVRTRPGPDKMQTWQSCPASLLKVLWFCPGVCLEHFSIIELDSQQMAIVGAPLNHKKLKFHFLKCVNLKFHIDSTINFRHWWEFSWRLKIYISEICGNLQITWLHRCRCSLVITIYVK